MLPRLMQNRKTAQSFNLVQEIFGVWEGNNKFYFGMIVNMFSGASILFPIHDISSPVKRYYSDMRVVWCDIDNMSL